jgi:hypothetical protein
MEGSETTRVVLCEMWSCRQEPKPNETNEEGSLRDFVSLLALEVKLWWRVFPSLHGDTEDGDVHGRSLASHRPGWAAKSVRCLNF